MTSLGSWAKQSSRAHVLRTSRGDTRSAAVCCGTGDSRSGEARWLQMPRQFFCRCGLPRSISRIRRNQQRALPPHDGSHPHSDCPCRWNLHPCRRRCLPDHIAPRGERAASMIAPLSAARVWLAFGHTDMRRSMNGLALQVQQSLQRDPHAGDLYVFRGKRGDLVKILWHEGLGMSLYAKRLERGRFIWPTPTNGAVSISGAQLSHMLDGID